MMAATRIRLTQLFSNNFQSMCVRSSTVNLHPATKTNIRQYHICSRQIQNPSTKSTKLFVGHDSSE